MQTHREPDVHQLPLTERWLYGARHPAWSPLVQAMSLAYGLGARLHRAAYRYGVRPTTRAPVPVISVGSLVVGGAGKTPVAYWCAQVLRQHVGSVAIVSRGYGRRSDAPELWRTGQPTPSWEAFGDEPCMLAERAQRDGLELVIAVHRQRAVAIHHALAAEPDIRAIVLDDGLQHYPMARDLDIVVVPPNVHGLQLLPAGPLRTPLASLPEGALCWHHSGCGRPTTASEAPVVSYYAPRTLRCVQPDSHNDPPPSRGVLLSAVGRNHLVRTLLARDGFEVAFHLSLRDHHPISADDLTRALRPGLPLITTEKDWPRVRSAMQQCPMRHAQVWLFEVELHFAHGRDTAREALLRVAA